VVEDTHSASEM